MAGDGSRASADQGADRLDPLVGPRIDRDATVPEPYVVGEDPPGWLGRLACEIDLGDAQGCLEIACPGRDEETVDESATERRIGGRRDDEQEFRVGDERLRAVIQPLQSLEHRPPRHDGGYPQAAAVPFDLDDVANDRSKRKTTGNGGDEVVSIDAHDGERPAYPDDDALLYIRTPRPTTVSVALAGESPGQSG